MTACKVKDTDKEQAAYKRLYSVSSYFQESRWTEYGCKSSGLQWRRTNTI